MITVSVVIATYNRCEGLKRAVNSVLLQYYKDYEIIVVDDCSTDNTEYVIRSMNDERIKYIKLPCNTGGSRIPRRVGVEASVGKYIAPLDDDDFWVDTSKLLQQVSFLEKNQEYVAVGTNAVSVGKDGEIKRHINYPQSDSDIREKMLMRNWFYHSSVLHRKQTYLDVGGYPLVKDGYYSNFANEYELWLKMGLKGKLSNLPLYGVGYDHFIKSLKLKVRVDFMIKHIRMIGRYKPFYPNYWKYLALSSVLAMAEIPLLIKAKGLFND